MARRLSPGASSFLTASGSYTALPSKTGGGNAMSMLLEQVGQTKAAERVMAAIQTVTATKMESMSAGQMGHSTSQVGDLVCEAL